MTRQLIRINPIPDVLLCLRPIELPSAQTRQSQLENAAVAVMITEVLGENAVIDHNADGKPLIDGYEISISHTRGLAAVMLSKDHRVGVDVEYESPRVGKIVSRFLRPDENAPTLRLQLLHWCAKEAVFKLFSEHDLTYQQMRVVSVGADRMDVWAEGCGTVCCRYLFQNGFCLVYVWL